MASPIVKNMNAIYTRDPKNSALEDWTRLLYDQALIAEGERIKDPVAYGKRVNALLVKASSEVAGEKKA